MHGVPLSEYGIVPLMKLVSWNVNGIRAVHKRGLFLPAIETLKPDILCLQETKAEQHHSEVDLPDYEEYWNSSKGRKGYSGTAIFSRETPLSVAYDFPAEIVEKYGLGKDEYGESNAEGRVIVAEYGPPAGGFFVVNVYTPNSKPDLSRLELRHQMWDKAFLAYCQELESVKPVIFCGDLNAAHTPDDLVTFLDLSAVAPGDLFRLAPITDHSPPPPGVGFAELLR